MRSQKEEESSTIADEICSTPASIGSRCSRRSANKKKLYSAAQKSASAEQMGDLAATVREGLQDIHKEVTDLEVRSQSVDDLLGAASSNVEIGIRCLQDKLQTAYSKITQLRLKLITARGKYNALKAHTPHSSESEVSEASETLACYGAGEDVSYLSGQEHESYEDEEEEQLEEEEEEVETNPEESQDRTLAEAGHQFLTYATLKDVSALRVVSKSYSKNFAR